MNRADFNQTGGFPLETDTLDFAQGAYNIFNALAAMAGHLTILSGCEQTGNTVAEGVVAINGEVLPFQSGPLGAAVIIREEVAERVFEDGESKVTYRTRTARFGTGTTSWPWSEFKRVHLRTMQKALIPEGTICMWSGSVNEIPDGWALCDGTNGTPNLKGRFVVGYDSGQSDYNAMGKTGGATQVTLSTSQLPRFTPSGTIRSGGGHSHPYRDAYLAEKGNDKTRHPQGGVEAIGTVIYGSGKSDTDNRYFYYVNRTTSSSGSHTHTFNGNQIGGDQPHENRPPYFTLAFIMFKG
ncbi:hypothetical protein LS482_16245 [Sinomicrobium kalidii]|uniref:hypothetical protein n=1 Tax=Sinomicrobium kalidii TaxID=2900738 RepID=UPI001E398E5B|nr:hypothetical protein [Sinomicrobium kalidii]UGU15224.1 hypothetical protein LS482_16245 [Sinomicrobium kalidii]